MSLTTLLGARGNLLDPVPEAARLVRLPTPVLRPADMLRPSRGDRTVVRTEVLDMTWPVETGAAGLTRALEPSRPCSAPTGRCRPTSCWSRSA